MDLILMHGIFDRLTRVDLYKQIPEEEELARQRFTLFRIFSITGMLVCAGIFFKMYFTISNPGLLPFLILSLSIVLGANFYYVSKLTALRASYLLMLSTAFVLLHVVSYSCGGIRTAGTVYFGVIILYAFMLLGRKAGKWFTALVIAHLVYLYLITTFTNWTSFAFFKNDISLINEDFFINFVMGFLLIAAQSSYLQSGKNEVVLGLEKSKRELERKNNLMLDKNQLLKKYAKGLEKSNKELDKFVTVASHDLKAPLRAIGALAGMIEEDSGDTLQPDSRKNLNIIKSRVERMEQLLNALLEYSRVNHLKSEETVVDTKELCEELRLLFCLDDNIKLNITGNFPVLLTDRKKLKQVISILIKNAIVHTDKKEVIMELCCFEKIHDWHFSFKDNGPGIDKAFYEKIFVIFQTLKGRDQLETVGAGLAIAKKIVEEWQGSIWVHSFKGSTVKGLHQGSEFHFSIPKAKTTSASKTDSNIF